ASRHRVTARPVTPGSTSNNWKSCWRTRPSAECRLPTPAQVANDDLVGFILEVRHALIVIVIDPAPHGRAVEVRRVGISAPLAALLPFPLFTSATLHRQFPEAAPWALERSIGINGRP